jgi:DNA polymerase III epsilon subunit-like protein
MEDMDEKSTRIQGDGDYTKRRHLFIAFDLETTGFRPQLDEILQIGAIHRTIRTIPEDPKDTVVGNRKKMEPFCVLLTVDSSIPRFITELTGITQDMSSSGHSPSVGIRMFFEYLGSISRLYLHSHVVVLCSWNGYKFDLPFLDAACRRIGLDLNMELKRAGVNCHVDVLEFARRTIPNNRVPHPTITGRPQYTLGNVHRCLTGRPIQDAHTATQDALAVLTILDHVTPWYAELLKFVGENLSPHLHASERPDGHTDGKDRRCPHDSSEMSPSPSYTTRTRPDLQENFRKTKHRRMSRRFSPLSLELA